MKPSSKSMEDIIRLIDDYLRSPNSQVPFNLIKRLSIIHPTKREGNIMNCYIDNDDH